MAHNIARWTARIGLGEQVVTTKTLRRRFFSLAGRITRGAPPHTAVPWPDCAPCHSLPDGGGGNRPPSGQPNVPANSPGLRVPLLRRYLALQHSQGHKVRGQTPAPLYPKSCPDHRPPLPLSPVPLLHSHPFGGFGVSLRLHPGKHQDTRAGCRTFFRVRPRRWAISSGSGGSSSCSYLARRHERWKRRSGCTVRLRNGAQAVPPGLRYSR